MFRSRGRGSIPRSLILVYRPQASKLSENGAGGSLDVSHKSKRVFIESSEISPVVDDDDENKSWLIMQG